ncbi:hypothetical protein R2F25_38130 [Streptomyces sp. UP1A-1]|nr:hypothetical protein [Streptomyces sp. UP1A-1]
MAPFEEPRFTRFAGASKIDCDPISPLEAECTDADGKVMSTKAATGPDSTIFTFSYGSERIGLRIFYDGAYAETWARQDGTQDLYPNLEVHGRYVLWGTDAARVKEYSDLLMNAGRGDVRAMGGREALPPRLAALTLGTLGLDQGEVHQLLAQSPTVVPADTPTIVAARLVLGMDQVPPAVLGAASENEDIVAIAAGIEPMPSTGGKTAPDTAAESDEAGGTVPVGTGGSGTGTTRPVTDTSPSIVAPPEPSAPPAETPPPTDTKPPAETTKPPTTTAPATPPPPQPEEPPADPAPTEPAGPRTDRARGAASTGGPRAHRARGAARHGGASSSGRRDSAPCRRGAEASGRADARSCGGDSGTS